MDSSGDYQILFIGVSCFCALIFSLRKRIDPLLVGFLSSLIYFSPTLFGRISFAYGAPAGDYSSVIVPGAYLSMLIVLLSLTLVALVYDRIPLLRESAVRIATPLLAHVLLAISLIGFFVSINTVGVGYLCVEKSDVLARIDGWYYIAAYGAPLAFACGLLARAWGVVALSILLLVADLFVGFRAGISVALIAFGLLFGHWLREGWRRRAVFFLIIIGVGATLFVVKQLAWNIKYAAAVDCKIESVSSAAIGAIAGVEVNGPKAQHNSSEQKSSLLHSLRGGQMPGLKDGRSDEGIISPDVQIRSEQLSDVPNVPKITAPVQFRSEQLSKVADLLKESATYSAAFRYAEPMVIQSILNEVVRNEFKTPPRYVLDHILSGVPGGKTIFGIDVSQTPSFNDLFQQVLFPQATFGMANNPWAQAYSAGGYVLVWMFALVYALGLALMAWCLSRFHGPIQGGIAVLVGWWGFYAHRNDLLIEVGIAKMVLYIFLVALLASTVISIMNKKYLMNGKK